MSYDENPFPSTDSDRHAIWEMLVRRDFEAFLAQDWSLIADDFLEGTFIGIDACGSANPDSWRVTFPDLAHYSDSWLQQARSIVGGNSSARLREELFRATALRDIELRQSRALAHKKFDGKILSAEGEAISLKWQTLYYCHKLNGRWKIAGFVGYLPNPMGAESGQPQPPGASKILPEGASEHLTAGPYSPILEVSNGLVVISGQAAIDPQGDVVGKTIEEQTHFTLEICRKQLASAGCTLEDVFKVTVYLADLKHWSRFNDVYKDLMPQPWPARTAVQTGLLPKLLVQIEMWAVKGS